MNDTFKAYAKILQGKDLVGMRFSSGYDYIDMPIDDVCRLFNLAKDSVVYFFESPVSMVRTIDKSPFSTKDNVVMFRSYNNPVTSSSKWFHDTKLRSLRDLQVTEVNETQSHVAVHRTSGIVTKTPVISPEKAFRAVEALDNLIYGTDFLSKFSVISIPKVDFSSVFSSTGEYNKEPVDAVEAKAIVYSSLPITLPEEKVVGWTKAWMRVNNINNIIIDVQPMKSVYQLTVKIVVSDTSEPYVPFKAPTAKLRFKNQKSVYIDSEDNYYFFGSLPPETIGFDTSTIRDTESQYDSTYLFYRMIPHNGQIYEMITGKLHFNYKAYSLTSRFDKITKAIDFMHKETPLDEMILNCDMDMPEVISHKVMTECRFRFVLDKNSYFLRNIGDEVQTCIYDAWDEYVKKHSNSWDIETTVLPKADFGNDGTITLMFYI